MPHRIRRAVSLAVLATAVVVLGTSCSALKRFGYEGFGRDDWQQPDRVIETLAIENGMQVADVGAGGGYFTFRLADAVGPEGRVYAVDVDESMLDYLRERAEEEGRANIEVVKGDFGDPLLPDATIDLVFSSNTYHHLEDPVAYFRATRADLKPGGRIAILDLNEGPFFAADHFTDPDEINRQMEEAGYERLEKHDFIEEQSFQIFGLAD